MLGTYQPERLHRKKEYGFGKRMPDRNGRRVLARRKAKGRAHLSYQSFEGVTTAWPFFALLFRKAGYGEVEVSQWAK